MVCVYVLFVYKSFVYFLKTYICGLQKIDLKKIISPYVVFILNILNIYLLFII